MFRDDCLDYKKGMLQVRMPEIPKGGTQKPRRTTKFDFSGTNYETCTLGHIACLEAMAEEDSELIEEICKQAREVAGIRKPLAPLAPRENDKYSTLQTNPEFLARALLFKKRKKNNVAKDADNHGSNNYEVNDLIDNADNDLPDERGDGNTGESDEDENGNGYMPTENGSQVDADELRDDADELGDDADEFGDDADELGDDADELGDDEW